MKKQFTKIKIAAENLSRSNKPDRKDFELETIEKQVEKYRDVLEKIVRKLPAMSSSDGQERDKRVRKNSHYKIGQALEESSKELPKEMPLHHVLANCGELEKSIAECIVDSELQTESEVVKRLKLLLDNEIQAISVHKRNVSRTIQEHASLKRSYEAAIRLDEPQAKINHIKEQQEQCELKLEKERDSWAAQMFELIANEDVIVQCIRDYVLYQRNYHERALVKVNSSLASIQDIVQSTGKSRFGTSLSEHLVSTNREISYILELCICCLIENGLYEEGLLRVGCASTKMRRMKHALEAQYVKTPLPPDYQDPHVIGSILKLYLRELPDPLLTYKYYPNFIKAVENPNEAERMKQIKETLEKLPKENYQNLRYLTKFLWLVTQNVEQNKMSSHNLAIVMSPNMLWPRIDKQNPADYLGQVNSSSAVNIIVELLIKHWTYFFGSEDVEFFVTLVKHKLFVEAKGKTNSLNDNADKSDGDSLESPRCGTIRRQKAYAPSPPAKSLERTLSAAAARPSAESLVVRNNDIDVRPKEERPSGGGLNETNQTMLERPPPPQIQTMSAAPLASVDNQLAKPVPMTRTQFFGLDNLPSPIADRRSNGSAGSYTLKPDLPQKPKIPKRPIALGLNFAAKSDEENTPASTLVTSSLGSTSGPAALYENHSIKNSTERFIGKLRNDICDNLTSTKDNNIDNNKITNTNTNTTEDGNLCATTASITTSTSASFAHNNNNNNSNSNSSSSNSNSSSSNNNCTRPMQANETRKTPTTPISPSMVMSAKRPTVPAPPPPTVLKKQIE